MSDETQPTEIDLLVNRLATKIGQLTVESEYLRVQLELAQKQQPQEADVVPEMNGHVVEEVPVP